VRHCTFPVAQDFSYDLHVLSTPPAFVLSQDQTLQFISEIDPIELGMNLGPKDDNPYSFVKEQILENLNILYQVF
jgi:hypothetical protein